MSQKRGPWAVAFLVVIVMFGPQVGGLGIGVKQALRGSRFTPAAMRERRARGLTAHRLTTTQPAVSLPASLTPPSMLQDTSSISYTVKRGESVESIAWRMLPQTAYMTQSELASAIREANGLEKRRLQPEQVVHIPGVPIHPFQDRPQLASKDFDARAIYLTGWTAGSLYGLKLVQQWKDVGGNAVVFDIKDFDGQVRVPYNHPYAPQRWITVRNLPKYIHWLHTLHMHVIARIALFRDEYLAQTYPQFDVRSRKTGKPWLENGKLDWVDPSLPVIQQYNLDLARMAAEAGADEIQFDYVRFPAEGDQGDAAFAFQKTHPAMPRTQVISDFVARAYQSLHPMNVRMSLDVFGVMAWARQADLDHTGQDIPQLARHCDILSPMIYPSHFFHFDGYPDPGDAPDHFISESLKRFAESTKGSGVVIRPWLQAFAWRTKSYSVEYVLTEVKVAEREGGIGFLFWNADNKYPKPLEAMTQIRAISGRAPARTAAQRAGG
jgi:hypothetical protein